MQLVLTITGENGEQLGRDARRVFGNEGGIIGRGNGSTWRLPDPTNTLSARHATIAHNGLGFTITDTSTNGVYINTVDVPLGRNNTAPLADGDLLYLGDYVLSVAFEQDVVDDRRRLGLEGSAAVRIGGHINAPGIPPVAIPAAPIPVARSITDPFAVAAPTPVDPLAALGVGHRPATPPPAVMPPVAASPDDLLFNGPGPQDLLGAPLASSPNGAASPFDGILSQSLSVPAPPKGPDDILAAMARELLGPQPANGFAGLPGGMPDLLGPAPPPPVVAPAPLGFAPPPVAPLAQAMPPVMHPPVAPAVPAQQIIPDDFDFSDLLGAAPPPMPAPPLAQPPAASLPPLPLSPVAPSAITPALPPLPGQPPSQLPSQPLAQPAVALPPMPAVQAAPLQSPALPPRPGAQQPALPPAQAPAPGGLQPMANRRPLSPALAGSLVALRKPGEAASPSDGRALDPLAVLRQRAGERTQFAGASARSDVRTPRAATPLPAVGGTHSSADDLAVFWSALEIDPGTIPPERRHDILIELGRALRETAEGLVSVLAARRSVKGELQMEQTRVQSGDNNPFKFLQNGGDALRKGLSQEPGFLPLSRAVREGFRDIKAHEMASAVAMRSAIGNVLTQLSPGVIEASTVTSPGLFGRKTDKSKLWDEFATLHSALVDDIDRTTRTVVGEEFARVYDQQLAQLRQAGKDPA